MCCRDALAHHIYFRRQEETSRRFEDFRELSFSCSLPNPYSHPLIFWPALKRNVSSWGGMATRCSAWLHLNVPFSSFEGLTWPPLFGTLRDGGKRLESRLKLSVMRSLTPICRNCFPHRSARPRNLRWERYAAVLSQFVLFLSKLEDFQIYAPIFLKCGFRFGFRFSLKPVFLVLGSAVNEVWSSAVPFDHGRLFRADSISMEIRKNLQSYSQK